MSAKTLTLTYDQLADVLKRCKQPAVDMGSMEEPDGYSELTPEQAKVADECWHKGMDNLECAVLNWAFDELGMSTQRESVNPINAENR